MAPTPPFHPRDFLVHPRSFGGGAAKLHPDLAGPGQRHRDRAHTAYLQSLIAYSVDRKIYDDGSLTRREVARLADLDERRFGRLMTGEAWMQLYDVTALGRVLGTDLLQVWQGPSFDQAGRWVTGP